MRYSAEFTRDICVRARLRLREDLGVCVCTVNFTAECKTHRRVLRARFCCYYNRAADDAAVIIIAAS